MAELFYAYAFGSIATVFLALLCAWAVTVRAPVLRLYARQIFYGTVVFSMASILWMQLGKASSLNYYADRATVLEMLWRSANGLGLTSPMSASFHTGEHWFAAHFTPIIYPLFVFPFWLFQTPVTLAFLQVVYVFSAVLPIWLFARRHLNAEAAHLFAASFCLYPTIHYIALHGPAYLELSIPLVAWLIYWSDSEDPRPAALFAFLSLMVREEMGLVLAGIGASLFLQGRRRRGVSFMVVGIAYTAIALKVIIPSFRSEESLVFMGNYKSWGDTPEAVIRNLFLHPLDSISHMISLPRAGNLVMYLLPLCFLPILAPTVLLAAVPNALSTFMSDSISNYNFTLYYLSPTLPILFLAAVVGAGRVSKRVPGGLPAIVWTVFFTGFFANHFFGPSPGSRQFWDSDYKVGVFHTTNYHHSQYWPNEGALAARRVASKVPRDAQVSAEQHLLPVLYDRRRMAVFPDIDRDIGYVVIDRAKREKAGWGDTYTDFRASPEYYYGLVEKSSQWELVAEDGLARLYRRRQM